MTETPKSVKRLLAVLFLVIAVAFVGTTIAIYNKVFSSSDTVELITDEMAFSLPNDADVKLRGVFVGTVDSVEPQGDEVLVRLAMNPELTDQIPANVVGRLLPKTLFGERYVGLAYPDDPRGELAAGDVIQQDTRGNALELGEVLDGLLPVLEAVPPEQLASTLGALNQALDGRGDQIGASLADIGRVFDGITEEMPALESGLQDLATFSQTYTEAVPDLIHALDSLRTTSNTAVERRDDIAHGLTRVSESSEVLTGFLATNRDDLISIAADSRDSLEQLAEYSGVIPCSTMQFSEAVDRSDEILGVDTVNPGIRVTIEIVNPMGRYLPNQDEPRMFDTRPPRCYEPAEGGEIFPVDPGGAIADGSYRVPRHNSGDDMDVPNLPNPLDAEAPIEPVRARGSVPSAPGQAVPERANDPFPSTVTAPERDGGNPMAMAYAGSDLESDTVRTVYGMGAGTDSREIPGWIGDIGAPALRGAEVNFE